MVTTQGKHRKVAEINGDVAIMCFYCSINTDIVFPCRPVAFEGSVHKKHLSAPIESEFVVQKLAYVREECNSRRTALTRKYKRIPSIHD